MVVFDELNGLPGNSVRDIQQDSSGTLFFATTNGVAKFREDTTVEILFEGIPFQKIFIDSRDRRWLIGSDGVYMEDTEGAIRFLNAEYPLLPEVVYHITEDPSTGNLLMATLSGVYLYDPVKEIVRQLSDTDSYSLYIDPNDSIWISTREGLLITHKEDLMSPGEPSEISNLNKRLLFPVQIISNIISNKYGSVWLVTDSQILQVLSTDQDPIIYEQAIGVKNNKILSFLIDREDNLWIGFSGGLQRLTNRKGLRNFYPTTINSYIYSVFQDVEERIWIASDNGIFYFQEDQLVNFTSRTGDGNSQFAGTLLPSGNILLANSKGLIEVDHRNLQILRRVEFGQVTHSPENVFAASSGEIFLLTGINGVIYYFPYMGAEPVELKNRFTANIYQLLEYHGKVVGGNSTGFVAFNGK
jgi:ligand-binding sensor domain-containing protein